MTARYSLRRIAGATLLVLLMAGVVTGLVWPEPSADVDEVRVALELDADAPSGRGAAQRTPATSLQAPHVPTPLPSLETPFAQVVEELEERSNRGDAAAACRLARGHLHCRQLPLRQREFDDWLREHEGMIATLRAAESDGLADAVSSFEHEVPQRERWLARLVSDCEGVEAPSPAAQVDLWRRAALAGNLAAMKQYASGNAFRWNSMMDALPELTRFRNEALPMALEVARRGDVEMLAALASAYSPLPRRNRSLLAQTVTPDAAMSLALYRHLLDAMDDQDAVDSNLPAQGIHDIVDSLSATLSAAELARAQRIAETELMRWSAPVVPLPGGRRFGLDGGVSDIDPRSCEDEAAMP